MRKRKNLAARMESAAAWLVRDAEQTAGHWREILPGCTRLLVELGCGMGRFACDTAAAEPESMIVALERVPDAIVIGMERARREGLQNIRFVLADAGNLEKLFAPGEIDRLFIHFCDPWPHWKTAPRRLVARNFLRVYRPLLSENGTLRFKTDNAPLFAFAQKELAAEGWIVTGCDEDSPPEAVMTEYETKFRALGVPIGALTARLF
ncbi:MAG: tRNA (guanosine(46)-N7)-methyltransferase TrmB [Oscillospiraceae bacterium]|jgi:tRNA (guanine-N7-)-methyltransferase|nr:tRNA (guanosine(46)-N7)-methyltransferase TrmB [Oscillospiraceae bacterium]